MFVAACLALACVSAALAQSRGPQPAPMPPPIPAPRDVPFPGSIRLDVDATDIQRHIFHVHETIPAAAGEMTLLYPQWLPGNHAPNGRVDQMAGLAIEATGPNRSHLRWTRDPVDPFAFHLTVPTGASAIDLDYIIASATATDQGRIVMTADMLNLQWAAMPIYPAGFFSRQITVQASVKLPEGWRFATALDAASTVGATTTFKPVPLETLVDSPIFAGRYFTQFDLGSTGGARVTLDVMADRPELLQATPDEIEAHRALVRQAASLFGSHHYDHYDLMLALTDKMGGIGLEHHRSSENGTAPAYFTDWTRTGDVHDLLAHEFTHSWNGKFRRPADLWTPNFNVPMRGSLLWVYEGQTQYWGYVLAARSGLLTRQQTLDALAAAAAVYDHRVGREWKTLQDTTTDPITGFRRPQAWRSFERTEDYYWEGLLVWLDVDTLIRERSGGRRSLDDFARAFFGIDDGSYVPVTYTFDDVVKALNGVEAYDWASFLRTRLDALGDHAPLDGFARGGYSLVYSDTPSEYFRNSELRRGITDMSYSLGLVTTTLDGRLTEVLWDSPAFQAGLSVGTQIVSVNGATYDANRLRTAIAATGNRGAVELVVRQDDRVRSVKLDYTGGLKYPHLQRQTGATARLDDILTPRPE